MVIPVRPTQLVSFLHYRDEIPDGSHLREEQFSLVLSCYGYSSLSGFLDLGSPRKQASGHVHEGICKEV